MRSNLSMWPLCTWTTKKKKTRGRGRRRLEYLTVQTWPVWGNCTPGIAADGRALYKKQC